MATAIRQGSALVRQPVFDPSGMSVGHRLRVRGLDGGEALLGDRNRWETEALLEGVATVGLIALAPTERAYLDVGTSMLHTDLHRQMPPGRLMLCLHEDCEVDEALVRRANALAGRGFRLALVDPRWRQELGELLRAVDLVRLTVTDVDATCQVLERLSGRVRTWVDGVQRPEHAARLFAAGASMGSGLWMERPTGEAEPLSRGVRRLLGWITDPELGAGDLVGLVQGPLERVVLAGLSADLHPVQTLEEAIGLLGVEPVRRWALLAAISRLERVRPAVLALALQRARTCWWLAPEDEGEAAFMAGLGSLLPAVLDVEARELSQVLTLRYPPAAGQRVQQVRSWESADFSAGEPTALTEAHVAAASWLRRIEPALLG